MNATQLRSDTRRWIVFLPALIWMIGIFVLSSRHDLPGPEGALGHIRDVFGHLIVFGILSLLFLFGLRQWGYGPYRGMLLAFGLTTAYGIFDELHHLFVRGRTADSGDLTLDAMGAIVFLIGWHVLSRRIQASQTATAASPPRVR